MIHGEYSKDETTVLQEIAKVQNSIQTNFEHNDTSHFVLTIALIIMILFLMFAMNDETNHIKTQLNQIDSIAIQNSNDISNIVNHFGIELEDYN